LTENFTVRVGVADDEVEAAIWKSALEAEGIPSMTRNMSPYGYAPHHQVLPGPHQYEVWVPRRAARKARRILGPSLRQRPPLPVDFMRTMLLFWVLFGWAVLLFVLAVTLMSVFNLWPQP
jgi:hypothetical protein